MMSTPQSQVIPVIAFIGRSGSGKTTLLERLIPRFYALGIRVALVKHTMHTHVETDIAGADTRRFWDAGAQHVALIAPDRVVQTRRTPQEVTLESVLASIENVGLILLEGFKRCGYPKIEVVRSAVDASLISGVEDRIAVVTDVAGACGDLPCYGFDDLDGLVSFIIAYTRCAGISTGHWQEIEHTADRALRVWGSDLVELFAAAAHGLKAILAGIEPLRLTYTVDIALRAPDVETLLVDWLNELLYEGDTHEVVFDRITIEHCDGETLRARIQGGAPATRTGHVKAATYHNLSVRRTEAGWETEIVLDA